MTGFARALPLCILILSCSDDDPAPPLGDTDGKNLDGSVEAATLDRGHPFDGFDPTCPMGPPCILAKAGEGKHAEEMLVIGEILTITGTDLQDVDTVYVGAAVAPIISISATEIRARIGPRTPPGLHGLEVKAGSKRRKVSGVLIRRLTAILNTDDAELLTYDTTTHTGGPALQLMEAPAAPSQVTATGRYLIVRGSAQLMVVDLPREEVAAVGGLEGQSITSVTTTKDDAVLLITTQGGAVFRADLSAFPSLSAQQVNDAPATLAIFSEADGTLLAGLHDDPAGQESSVWFAPADLATPQWVMAGGQPYLIGSGVGLAPLDLQVADGLWATVTEVEGTAHLAIMREESGQLSGAFAAAFPQKSGLAIAAGGDHLALAGASSPPSLTVVSVSGDSFNPGALSLGSSASPMLMPFRLPSSEATVGVLVGPAASGAFIAGTLEMVDLEGMTRLTAAGGAALTLADMRAAVADPLSNIIHLITGGEFRSYDFAIQDALVTLTERQPHMFLPGGKVYRWIAVQP